MERIKIWVDDVRPKPVDYNYAINSVWDFISLFSSFVREIKENEMKCFVIDLDHDAGDYERFGGDYYNILKWFEYAFEYDNDFVRQHIVFTFHTANPIGLQNMKNICERNNWIVK